MLDYFSALARAEALEDVWDLHCRTMESFGFDRLIYGYTRFLTEDSFGDFEDAMFLTNHSKAYVDGFIHTRLFLQAPVFHWACENVGACSWGDIWGKPEALTDEEKRVIAFNTSMDVTAGYSISFAEHDPRTFGMIALAARAGLSQADADAIWAMHGDQIETMNQMAHLKIRSLPYPARRGGLSTRQREVLEGVAQGKSNHEIAKRIGVSVATVEKHLRLARERLGVETTAQALLKATFLNQVYRL